MASGFCSLPLCPFSFTSFSFSLSSPALDHFAVDPPGYIYSIHEIHEVGTGSCVLIVLLVSTPTLFLHLRYYKCHCQDEVIHPSAMGISKGTSSGYNLMLNLHLGRRDALFISRPLYSVFARGISRLQGDGLSFSTKNAHQKQTQPLLARSEVHWQGRPYVETAVRSPPNFATTFVTLPQGKLVTTAHPSFNLCCSLKLITNTEWRREQLDCMWRAITGHH
jgi:hypothetical protein